MFSTPVQLATVTADANGNVTATVTIPATMVPGNHTIQLQGVDPSGAPLVESVGLVVPAPVGTLSLTGAWLDQAVAFALILVAAGWLLISAQRKRVRARA
jgi:hypothetical protein